MIQCTAIISTCLLCRHITIWNQIQNSVNIPKNKNMEPSFNFLITNALYFVNHIATLILESIPAL